MTTLRGFRATDLYKFNHINLDALTETYSSSFYMVRASSADCNVLYLLATCFSLLLLLSPSPFSFLEKAA